MSKSWPPGPDVPHDEKLRLAEIRRERLQQERRDRAVAAGALRYVEGPRLDDEYPNFSRGEELVLRATAPTLLVDGEERLVARRGTVVQVFQSEGRGRSSWGVYRLAQDVLMRLNGVGRGQVSGEPEGTEGITYQFYANLRDENGRALHLDNREQPVLIGPNERAQSQQTVERLEKLFVPIDQEQVYREGNEGFKPTVRETPGGMYVLPAGTTVYVDRFSTYLGPLNGWGVLAGEFAIPARGVTRIEDKLNLWMTHSAELSRTQKIEIRADLVNASGDRV